MAQPSTAARVVPRLGRRTKLDTRKAEEDAEPVRRLFKFERDLASMDAFLLGWVINLDGFQGPLGKTVLAVIVLGKEGRFSQ